MKLLLIFLNSAFVVMDAYGIAYWHEPKWTVLLAFNAVALAVVLATSEA